MASSLVDWKDRNLKNLFRFELKFYKELADISKYTKIYLNIPELIINGFGFNSPTLMCTDYRTGELLIKESLSKQAISESFSLFTQNTEHPIAVCKTKQKASFKDKNQIIFTPFECDYSWNYNSSQEKPLIIQRFIRNPLTAIYKSEYSSSGKIKTYLIRKKNAKNLNQSIIFKKKNMERLKYLLLSTDLCSKYTVSAPIIDDKMIYLVYLIEKYYTK